MLRKQIEVTVEQLLTILDHFDGDADLEDDGNAEPWLGFTENVGRGADNLKECGLAGDDREFAHDDHGEPEEPDSDYGWFEVVNQADCRSRFSGNQPVV